MPLSLQSWPVVGRVAEFWSLGHFITLTNMETHDLAKELWGLANIVTGFSVAQSVGIAIALGKDLAGLQKQTVAVKTTVSGFAIIFAGGYCFAVWRCWSLVEPIETNAAHRIIWEEATYGRMACIGLFTLVLIFGLFAPNIFKNNSNVA